jgi:hypothetical protein
MTWQSSLALCCAAIVAGLADEGVWADRGAPQAVWVALMTAPRRAVRPVPIGGAPRFENCRCGGTVGSVVRRALAGETQI